jgi:hypothetical protein
MEFFDDESGDNAEPFCNQEPAGPSTAMIAIMAVSMLCTFASAVKTVLGARRRPTPSSYDTFDDRQTEMLELRMPAEHPLR